MSRERDLIGQINDLKRQNRDLRLEMMEAQNAGAASGGGNNAQLVAMQQHIQKLEAALAHASAGGRGASPDASRALNELKRQNRDLKQEVMRLQQAGGGGGGDNAPMIAAMRQHIQKLEAEVARGGGGGGGGGGLAPAGVYDDIISTLEGTLSHLKRDRDRAPTVGGGGGGGGADAELLRGQLKELERLNRDLERDLSRARESGGGGGGADPALRAEYERAVAHIRNLEQQLQSGGRGDLARQINELKRENRDLRLQGGGGGGGDDAALKQKIQQLEAQLARAQSSGGGGGDGALRAQVKQAYQHINDRISTWRGDLRTIDGFVNDIREVFAFVKSIDASTLTGSSRARYDDFVSTLDLSFLIEDLERLVRSHQESAGLIKKQLSGLRSTLQS